MQQRLLTPLALVISILLSSQVFSADNSLIVGNWDLRLNLQGQAVNIVISINDTDEGLTGSWKGPQATTELTDVSFDGETLSFSRVGRQGRDVNLSLKLEGDTLTGSFRTRAGELPITAKRSN